MVVVKQVATVVWETIGKISETGLLFQITLKGHWPCPFWQIKGMSQLLQFQDLFQAVFTAVAVGRDQQGLLCWPENTRKNESDFFDAATPYETTKIDQSIKIGLLYFIIFLMTTQRCA